MRADLDGGEVGAGPHRERTEDAGLAAGAGAQVEPPGRHGPRSRTRSVIRPGQGQGDELRALVLHRGAAVTHRGEGPGVPGGQDGPDRGEGARGRVRAVDELVDAREPRPGHEVHERRLVVGLQQRRELDVDRLPRGAAVRDQRGPQGGDDPLGVAVEHRKGRCAAPVRHDGIPPLLDRALADPTHDGVDEAAGTRPRHDLGEPDGLVRGRVRRDAHPEQLVRAEAEHVEHLRVDARGRAPGGLGDDGVVEALPADRAEGELGGEGGVTPLEPVPAQDGRQLEVRVGAVRDRAQERVRREPGRLGPAGAL